MHGVSQKNRVHFLTASCFILSNSFCVPNIFKSTGINRCYRGRLCKNALTYFNINGFIRDDFFDVLNNFFYGIAL